MENPLLKLIELRWNVDSLVYLQEFDSNWWLKPCIDKNGNRIGITGCCQSEYECNHHKNIRNKIIEQKANLN